MRANRASGSMRRGERRVMVHSANGHRTRKGGNGGAPPDLDTTALALHSTEVLGQLQAHRQLADLGAGQRQLALLGIAPTLQPAPTRLQEDPLPALQFVRRDLALPRDSVQRLAPE